MATTITPPAVPATPALAPAPASAPPSQDPREASRARIAAALSKPPEPSPTPAPSTATGEGASTAQPSPEAAPEGGATASAPPPLTSIDDIDLEEVIQPATGAEAAPPQPEPTQAAPAEPNDPLALVNKVATGLGIQPEVLTTTPEGRQILTSLRYREALEAPPTPDGKGGLGILPAVSEVREAFEGAAAMDAFEWDYEANPQNAILYLVAPDLNAQNGNFTLRPGALAFLDALPQALDRLGKVRFQNGNEVSLLYHAARPFLAKAADELYDAANATENTEEKAAMLQAARIFERSFFKRDRMAKAPAESEESRALRERLRDQETRQQANIRAQQDQNSQNFHAAVLRTASQRIESAVDKILTDGGYASTIDARALPALREQIIEEAINLTSGNSDLNLTAANPLQYQAWQVNFQRWSHIARTQIRKDGVAKLAESYYRLSQPNIRAVAKRILGPQVSTAQTTNGAAHAQARTAAARVEPGAQIGSPKPQSVLPQPEARGAEESFEDYGKRLLGDKLRQHATVSQTAVRR